MTKPDDAAPGPQDETPPNEAPLAPGDSAAESSPLAENPAEGAQQEQASRVPAEDAPGGDADQAAASTANSDTSETGEIAGEEAADDDLPEWEPLTPELVEDEAIRGDFMLRWAAVLLAFLFACSEVYETSVLVSVKTGQWITQNGWLPPTSDLFSYTAADRPWVNLHWLFDVLLAGAYGVAGSAGLTLVAACCVAAAFYLLSRISEPEVPTWWGSILATIALIACLPHFLPTPAVVTLLGVGCMLSILHRAQFPESGRVLWLAVPLIAVWSHLDPRMFVGLAILAFYAVGDAVGVYLGLTQDRPEGWRRQLWLVTGACVGAAMLNPFGWHSLLAPWELYTIEDPVLRQFYLLNPGLQEMQYFGLIDAVFWESLGHQAIAALVLLGITTVTLVLNRDRFDSGWFAVLLGMVGLSFLASRELAVAALVAAVLGNLNGQQWYKAKFRQAYSVELKELIFSRGGRAATVLAMFGLAFLAISGRLTGEEGARTGAGFSKELTADIEGLSEQLAESYDDRPFNFRFDQGDVLIWLGKKVFVDSRIGVYASSTDDELLAQFNQIRRALRRADAGMTATDAKGIWKEPFDRYEVTHVIPRLSSSPRSPQPDYLTYQSLLHSAGDWQLTNLGPVTAVFYRRDLPELQPYLDTHGAKFIEDAFRTEHEPLAERPAWPSPPSVYQGWLSPRKAFVPNEINEAIHRYQTILLASAPGAAVPAELGLSLAYMAVRNANAGLVEHPSSAEAFALLGDLYRYIANVEEGILRGQPDWPQNLSYVQTASGRLRYLQAVQSYRQCLVVDPQNTGAHFQLYNLFLQGNRPDLALNEAEEFLRLATESQPVPAPENEGLQQIREVRDQLGTQRDDMQQLVQKALDEGTDPLQVAQAAFQQGFALEALRVLDMDPTLTVSNPVARHLKAHCLLEAGRAEEAAGIFEQMQGYEDPTGRVDVRTPIGMNFLAQGEYGQAIDVWNRQLAEIEERNLRAALSTLPLAQPPPEVFRQDQIPWPIPQIMAAQSLLFQQAQQGSSLRWYMTMAQLEQGSSQAATETIRALLEHDEESLLRPMARVYLYLLTGELIEPEPPSGRIPVSADMFADEQPGRATDSDQKSDKAGVGDKGSEPSSPAPERN